MGRDIFGWDNSSEEIWHPITTSVYKLSTRYTIFPRQYFHATAVRGQHTAYHTPNGAQHQSAIKRALEDDDDDKEQLRWYISSFAADFLNFKTRAKYLNRHRSSIILYVIIIILAGYCILIKANLFTIYEEKVYLEYVTHVYRLLSAFTCQPGRVRGRVLDV
jgi:hypothetical protein